MKILDLNAQGFRSLKDIDWRPGDLNVVIGANTSGKSNLLSLLEMISQAAKGNLGRFVVSQGGITPLLWDGRADAVNVDLTTSPAGEADERTARYCLKIAPLGQTAGHTILTERFRLAGDREGDPEALGFERTPGGFLAYSPDVPKGMEETWANGANQHEETVLSMIGSGTAGVAHLLAYRGALTCWGIHEQIDTTRDGACRGPAVTRYETALAPDGDNLIAFLHTMYTRSREFKSEVDAAMHAAFEDEFEELLFSPVASNRVELRVRWKSLNEARPAPDLSDGTLRFLYLIAILADPAPPALIAVDEPETGLHPRMLPIVADYAMSAATRTQVILTTHSPEFLDAFRDEPPTTTVAELVHGETKLRVIEGEELAYWLKEYTLGDIYRTGQLESME